MTHPSSTSYAVFGAAAIGAVALLGGKAGRANGRGGKGSARRARAGDGKAGGESRGAGRPQPPRRVRQSELRKGAMRVPLEELEDVPEGEEEEEEEEVEEEAGEADEEAGSAERGGADEPDDEEDDDEEEDHHKLFLQAVQTTGGASETRTGGTPAKGGDGGAAPAPAQKGPKTYVTLPDGSLLTLRVPLDGISSAGAELEGALRDAICLQLERDRKASAAQEMARSPLQVEYLPSLQAVPELADEFTPMSSVREAKGLKVSVA